MNRAHTPAALAAHGTVQPVSRGPDKRFPPRLYPGQLIHLCSDGPVYTVLAVSDACATIKPGDWRAEDGRPLPGLNGSQPISAHAFVWPAEAGRGER